MKQVIIVDKEIDHKKTNEKTERSSIEEIDYNHAALQTDVVKEQITKWRSRIETSRNIKFECNGTL